jgi:autotransporter-associated beta strand protein
VSGTNSFAGAITLASASTIGSQAGILTLSGDIGGNFALTVTGTGDLDLSGVRSGTGGLTKTGSGTVTLSGANTFTGSTTVNAGTLKLAAGSGSALGSTSSIAVNSGGTLLLGASDQINNSATMALAGGTFAKGNFSEGTANSLGLGALSLTAAGSHVDFGIGTVGIITFASFAPGAFTLTIDNWSGTANMVGDVTTDRLIFNSDQSANLAAFVFTGYSGATQFGLGGGFFEITPIGVIPEPATYFPGFFALGLLGWDFYRRRRSLPPK